MSRKNNLIFALVAGVAGIIGISNIAQAQPVLTGEVGVVSRDIYRGVQTNDEVSAFASARVSNLFVDGLFVDGSFNTIDNEKGRGRVGVGYGLTHGDFSWEVSANRNIWADQFAVEDFTEFTGRVGYNILGVSKVFAEVSYAPNAVGNDLDVTYATAGVDFLVTDKFTVGAAVTGYNFEVEGGPSDTTYHATYVTASYNVWNKFDVFGQYSFGGDAPYGLGNIDNVSNVGVRYRF